MTQSRTDCRPSIGTGGTKDGELMCAIALARKAMLSSVSSVLRSIFKALNPASKPACLVAGLGWSDSSDMLRGVKWRGGDELCCDGVEMVNGAGKNIKSSSCRDGAALRVRAVRPLEVT